MPLTAKITTVGNSTGIVLPKEILERLNLQKGDTLYITESPDGIQLTPYDPEFEKTMQAAREGMRKYRNALRKLAE